MNHLPSRYRVKKGETLALAALAPDVGQTEVALRVGVLRLGVGVAARVAVRVDPEMSPRRSDYPTAVVEVALRDGRTHTASTTAVRGDFEDPVPGEEVVEKFLALAAGPLGAGRARDVVRIGQHLAFPLPEARALRYGVHKGRADLLLGLRPEHITEPRPGSPGEGALLTATVDVAEPMGLETMLFFSISGTEVCARVEPGSAKGPGEVMPLRANMSHMHLIDPRLVRSSDLPGRRLPPTARLASSFGFVVRRGARAPLMPWSCAPRHGAPATSPA